MEFFGSDEDRPIDYCLEQVRKADLFVGVYAELYGSVDAQSRKSFVDLEYSEALKMLERDGLKGLLVYMLDDQASWPKRFIERDPEKVVKLEDLKRRICSRHTVTFFNDTEELPFCILRDVIRKIGISSRGIFSGKLRNETRPRTALDRPIGMEYYTDEMSSLFRGRDRELDELCRQIIQYRMSLLIGASGIGKTSLISAGLVSRVREWGWQVALVRPLADPVANLKRFTWDQLLEGNLPTTFNLPDVLRAASVAHKGRTLLLVIDQFEDVLGPLASSAIGAVTHDLLSLFRGGPDNLRILVSYRGDVDHRVGTIWQAISGAATGLPRTYLGPLQSGPAQIILRSTLQALGLSLSGDHPDFIGRAVADLEVESALAGHPGIYPPFLQMLIARIFDECGADTTFGTNRYFEIGASRRIIADYLMSQLKYLGDKAEVGKRVLISLVNSYGTKDQKTLEEVCLEAAVSREQATDTLGSLVDLRMVRNVDGVFEVSHDFLAKMIVMELVSSEERDAKRFKDLLSSQAAAYEVTKTGLSSAEHLQIYKFRHRIPCGDIEFRLLLESHLQGNGPIWYWARRYDNERLLAWTHALIADAHREEFRQSGYRFLIRLGEKPDLTTLADVFSDFKLQNELAEYIDRFATHDHLDLLFSLNRKKGDAVVLASESAMVRNVLRKDVGMLDTMAKSRSKKTAKAFERIGLAMGTQMPIEELRWGLESNKPWERILCAHGIGAVGEYEDIALCQCLLAAKPSLGLGAALIKATARIAMRLGEDELVRGILFGKDLSETVQALQAIDGPCSATTVSDVFALYKDRGSSYCSPFDVATAIRRLASKDDLPALKRILATAALGPPAREFVYAVCSLGGEEEFSFLFNLFLNHDGEIAFWNPVAVVDRLSKMATNAHLPMVSAIVDAEEFWNYYTEADRPQSRIPVCDYRNVHFMRRLAAAAYGKIAQGQNLPTIYRMLQHEYWVVWHPALQALSTHGTEENLAALIDAAGTTASRSEGLVAGICALDERIYRPTSQAAAC